MIGGAAAAGIRDRYGSRRRWNDERDLNAHVLRDETSTDAHQLLVNAHTYEHDHHWPWYLDDLVALGWDASRPASDVLRGYHDESTVVGRMLTPRLAHLIYGATPIERLVIIEAIEETGNVRFELTARLARRIQAEEGVVLRYLGDFHLELESGHAMNGSDHRELAAIVLTDAQRERCPELVARVFCLFEAWTDELFVHASTTPSGARDRPFGQRVEQPLLVAAADVDPEPPRRRLGVRSGLRPGFAHGTGGRAALVRSGRRDR